MDGHPHPAKHQEAILRQIRVPKQTQQDGPGGDDQEDYEHFMHRHREAIQRHSRGESSKQLTTSSHGQSERADPYNPPGNENASGDQRSRLRASARRGREGLKQARLSAESVTMGPLSGSGPDLNSSNRSMEDDQSSDSR